MHVIKGMVGCLGDMEAVMVKLHEKEILANLSFFYCTKIPVILKEELDRGDNLDGLECSNISLCKHFKVKVSLAIILLFYLQ